MVGVLCFRTCRLNSMKEIGMQGEEKQGEGLKNLLKAIGLI